MDLLACFPIDLIIYAVSSHNPDRLHFLGLLKVLRLPRLLRLAQFVRILRVLRIPPEWKRWILYSRYAHLIRLFSLIISFVFIIHIITCTWNAFVVHPDWAINMYGSSSTNVDMYLLGFYYSLTTIMGQSVNLATNSEYAFSCCVIILGALLMAVVFGNVAILIANFYENQSSYKKKARYCNFAHLIIIANFLLFV